jgi:hypothetical protein
MTLNYFNDNTEVGKLRKGKKERRIKKGKIKYFEMSVI